MDRKRSAVIGTASAVMLLTGAAKVDLVTAIDDPRDPDTCLSVQQVTFAPGEGSRSHTHDATVVAYVLRGGVESQVDDEPLRTYRAGEHWVERPRARHVVARNASADEPATFLAVMLAHRGSDDAKACSP